MRRGPTIRIQEKRQLGHPLIKSVSNPGLPMRKAWNFVRVLDDYQFFEVQAGTFRNEQSIDIQLWQIQTGWSLSIRTKCSLIDELSLIKYLASSLTIAISIFSTTPDDTWRTETKRTSKSVAFKGTVIEATKGNSAKRRFDAKKGKPKWQPTICPFACLASRQINLRQMI